MTRILHLSDPHFGAMDIRVSESFLSRAAEMKPDLTILSGDLTMRARRGELAAASAFVERLPKPMLLIPGNHDIPSFNQPIDRFFSPFARYRETFGEELEPELRMGGLHVVSLNSSRAFGFHSDWSEGRLSRKQLAKMREKFLSFPGGDFRILVLHHPLLGITGREVVKPLKHLLQAVEDARVDMVMCGHFHLSQIHPAGLTANWRAVISQAPTVCSTRLQGEPQGFHEILWEGDRLDTVHHVFEGGAFHPVDRLHFARGATGWQHAA